MSKAYLIEIGDFGIGVGTHIHDELFRQHNIDPLTGLPNGEPDGNHTYLFEEFEQGLDGQL